MTIVRDDLKQWVFLALKELGGKAKLIDVADHIWSNHEKELRSSRRGLLTWQYDMRWAATELRKMGLMEENKRTEPWQLTAAGMKRTAL